MVMSPQSVPADGHPLWAWFYWRFVFKGSLSFSKISWNGYLTRFGWFYLSFFLSVMLQGLYLGIKCLQITARKKTVELNTGK